MFSRLLRRRRARSSVGVPVLPSLEAYALWAATYPPHAHNALMQAEQTALLALLPSLERLRVLDLACGTGRYARLAEARGAQVIGLDNSAAMLKASALSLSALATVQALPLATGSIDGVICALALGHLPSLIVPLAEISRVLRPGGWALLSDFHPYMVLAGAERTFTAPDGRTYAVEHHLHLWSDYLAAASAAGLLFEAAAEPALDSSATSAPPVVLVVRLRKPLRAA
ncbi:MAG: class I SAM-dependent methyltransferase [Aggregatilineales bacterium]